MNENLRILITGLATLLLPVIIWQALQNRFPKMQTYALVGFTALILFGVFVAIVVIRMLF